MNKNRPKTISWEEIEAQWVADPKFVEGWKKIEPEYQLARQIIRARLDKKLTQANLAEKIGTDQAVISRLEGASAHPSLKLIQRVAAALDTPITLVVQ